MPARPNTDRLTSPDILARHLKSLLRRDPRLKPIAKAAGPFDIRLTPAGFPGLARVIAGQQLSVASARAIWGRVSALEGALTPDGYLRLDEALIRGAGFSAGKHRTVSAIAGAIAEGRLDLEAIARLSAEDAVAALTAHKGIGPWTAEIYLMFCLGHSDIFPVGDLALRKAVGHALGMKTSPAPDDLTDIASAWAPNRHAAALLFWRYYASVLGKAAGTAL